MQAVFPKLNSVVQYIIPNEEAKSADDDEAHDNDIDEHIADERRKRGKRSVRTEKIKACIAERRYGMENPIEYAFSRPKELAESYG